jgi:hypothetical protein
METIQIIEYRHVESGRDGSFLQGLRLSTIEVGIRIVAPRSFVVS